LIRAAVVLLAMAMPAAADPVASFRIEAELAAVGQAPAIEAMPGDIEALNQHAGPALEVTLHPRFDAAVADLTRGRTGQRLITMPEPRAPRLCVLIDADNVPSGYAEAIFEEIASLGEASVRRIYGDWSAQRLAGWAKKVAALGLVADQQFSNTKGKNASDIGLVIAAMDFLHSGLFDGFVLVSSDSDFTRLAARIREQGLDVYGIGEKKTPEAFRMACKRFIYVENLGVADEAPEPAPRAAPEGRTARHAQTRHQGSPRQGHPLHHRRHARHRPRCRMVFAGSGRPVHHPRQPRLRHPHLWQRETLRPRAQDQPVRGPPRPRRPASFFAPAVEGTAIAFAPRLVLHPAHAPFRDGDPPRQPMLHPGLDRSSSPGLRPIVMIDPRHEADAVFANTVVRPAYPETRIVELQGAGHRVAKLLAYQGLLKPVVRAILATNEVPAIPFDARNRPRRHLTLAIEAMTQGDMMRAGTLLRRVAADPGITGFAEARALWEDTTGRKLQGRPPGRKARTGPAA
jgi:uncharacterized LabA/DUF88 family protein